MEGRSNEEYGFAEYRVGKGNGRLGNITPITDPNTANHIHINEWYEDDGAQNGLRKPSAIFKTIENSYKSVKPPQINFI